MLGTRGCRLGILHPEIYEMQVRAIVARRARAVGGPDGRDHASAGRLRRRSCGRLRALTEAVIEEEGGGGLEIHGRHDDRGAAGGAAGRRDRARTPTSSRFGTNDLTQTTLGVLAATTPRASSCRATSRTACSRGTRSRRSTDGVGELVELAVERGRARAAGHQARHLRRARRRSGVDRVLPRRRARLRLVLAVPGADRAAGRRAGGARDGR